MKLQKETYKEIGKYILDISKIIIGSLILSSAFIDKLNSIFVLCFGIISFIILLVLGISFINKK